MKKRKYLELFLSYASLKLSLIWGFRVVCWSHLMIFF